jgi:hypothetical protein
VWEGKGVVKSARKLIGATNPLESEPGTIRGDLAVQTGRNVVHGSDSPENGERETGARGPPVRPRAPLLPQGMVCSLRRLQGCTAVLQVFGMRIACHMHQCSNCEMGCKGSAMA